MQMVRWKEKDHNGYYDREVPLTEHRPTMSCPASIHPISSSSVSSSPSGLGYIEHPISKLDTLAGIAIMYGVEVADIKKMNGLVTDLQMFALKTLHIPLPGRHPPSPCLSNGSDTTGHSISDHRPPDQGCRELFESFQSQKMKSSEQKVSPAMSSLNSSENGSLYKNLLMPGRPLSHDRKSKSLVNVILAEIEGRSDVVPDVEEAREGDLDKWNDDTLARRHKDSTGAPVLLLKEDNGSSRGFSSRTGKGLAQRQKAVSRTALKIDSESNGLNPIPIAMRYGSRIDGSSGVRKSSSTSCLLQDQYNSNYSPIWSTSRWGLSPDLQGISTATTDGRRNKAAID